MEKKKKNDDFYAGDSEEDRREAVLRAAADKAKRARSVQLDLKRSGGRRPVSTRNQLAFAIGLCTGMFGLWGVAHVLNNKVVTGLAVMFFLTPAVAAILIGVAIASASSLACLVVPVWLLLAYAQAADGAQLEPAKAA